MKPENTQHVSISTNNNKKTNKKKQQKKQNTPEKKATTKPQQKMTYLCHISNSKRKTAMHWESQANLTSF